ncbi:CHAT domain-containing protein [Suillus fuscotomentosus]|uniref:CHAT domain-containing protein n=1 Tax=Suillus fuscotomentosus TaxID=1912939 RepID=A0AAD4DTT7_9AGAM|nr:CHAT domain-containing protein [Suillus fuscotomentosus]KAG1893731.1 CHAT domain-containing protein [Suillus fuscotomentosus]
MLPIVNVLEHVLKLKRPLSNLAADRSGKEPCLEDLYICSYTPTLSALIRSRQLMKKRVPPSFVAIGQGQPGAGKGKALLAVDSELELVHKLVPATANRTTISGNAATRAGALEALQQNTWVHLACHGKQDPKQPYDSHFVMRDEHLTLLDIMERHVPQAEFAFLSACHTAVGDEETPDEVIHLAAGIQFSGFKSVVGTLWEVDDSVAKHVVEAFYGYIWRFEGWWCHGLYEGGLGTQLCYARGEDESTARTENGFRSYRCVVPRRIAICYLGFVYSVTFLSLTEVLMYLTHLQLRLLLGYLDSGS